MCFRGRQPHTQGHTDALIGYEQTCGFDGKVVQLFSAWVAVKGRCPFKLMPFQNATWDSGSSLPFHFLPRNLRIILNCSHFWSDCLVSLLPCKKWSLFFFFSYLDTQYCLTVHHFTSHGRSTSITKKCASRSECHFVGCHRSHDSEYTVRRVCVWSSCPKVPC